MKYPIALLLLFATHSLPAQNSLQGPPDMQKATLEQRFQWIKSKSQTFQDYKVIKENTLDGLWRITQDSVRTGKALLNEAKVSISSLEGELETNRRTLADYEATRAEIVYDSNHITVLGIPFLKGTFLGVVTIIVLGLFVMLGMLIARLKWFHSSIREKVEMIDSTKAEFEEYKRKSLERQTKLSRELQNERNKLVELGRGSARE